MATSKFSAIDEYGFPRPENVEYATLERILSDYLRVLARRQMRWQKFAQNHDLTKSSRTLKRFIRKGVPGPMRKTVWLKVSGAWAAQQREPMLYTTLKQSPHDREIADMIRIDLPRTFPDNIYFETIQQNLFNVLMAYSKFNKTVGYCQGLNYIGGLILIVTKDEESTFWLLKHLLENVTPNYHTKTMSGLVTDIAVLEELVRSELPGVYHHVKRMDLSFAVIVTKWFICLYSEVLPTETVFRIWDCIFAEGYKILFRVALTLITIYQNEILATDDITELSKVFKGMVNGDLANDCHKFMKLMFTTSPKLMTRANIDRLRQSLKGTPLR